MLRIFPRVKGLLKNIGRRQINLPSKAAIAQTRGMARLEALERSLSAGSLESDISDITSATGTSTTSFSTSSTSTATDTEIIQDELQQWLLQPLTENVYTTDLIRFWQVGGISIYHVHRKANG